jgi:hypothetical protein
MTDATPAPAKPAPDEPAVEVKAEVVHPAEIATRAGARVLDATSGIAAVIGADKAADVLRAGAALADAAPDAIREVRKAVAEVRKAVAPARDALRNFKGALDRAGVGVQRTTDRRGTDALAQIAERRRA